MTYEAVLATPSMQRRQSSQLIRYVILGTLGLGIILGVRSTNKESIRTTQPTQTSPATPTAQPIQTQPNPSAQPIPTAQPQMRIVKRESNLVVWLLMSVMISSSGYVIFQWLSERLAKQQKAQITSIPEANLSSSASVLSSELTPTMEDEVQVAQAVLQATSKKGEILTSEYFPLTARQMKQIWRYLRRPVREGQATELDVEATVNQIGRQGILLKPVLVPRRINRAEMLLLIDQDGSMVPFHALSYRLAETALRGGRLGRAGIYYFHNCPIENLYHDPHHQEGKLITDIVTHVCSERTAILIFSDAGAARGGYNQERYELTQEFLAQLKQRVRYIAWLNPLPKERWLGTTAGDIARLVPMFEVNRRSMQDAIGVLRGCPTNYEGRRI